MLSLKRARQVVILVIGSSVILLGIALLVLPGPAFIVIPAGVAILGTEFLWARRVFRRIKSGAQAIANTVWNAGSASAPSDDPDDKRTG